MQIHKWPNEQQAKIPIKQSADRFPRKGNMNLFFDPDIVNPLLKTSGEETED